jgi:hypothetical protein
MDSQKGKSHQQNWQPPNPKRFEHFTISKDGRSFLIEGSSFTFVFDEQGGWEDEFGNYYDANGNPMDYDDDHYGEDDKFEGYDVEDAEKFVLEYDLGGGHDDEDDHLHHFDNIYANTEGNKRIDSILDNTTIEIEISNINYQVKEEEFKKYISQQSKAHFDKCEFERLDPRRHKGKCVVSVSNKQEAKKIVGLNNRNFEGRQLKVQVLTAAAEEEEDSHPVSNVDKNLIALPPGINSNSNSFLTNPPGIHQNSGTISRPLTAPVSSTSTQSKEHTKTASPSKTNKVENVPGPVGANDKPKADSKPQAIPSKPEESKKESVVSNSGISHAPSTPVEEKQVHVAGSPSVWGELKKVPKKDKNTKDSKQPQGVAPKKK